MWTPHHATGSGTVVSVKDVIGKRPLELEVVVRAEEEKRPLAVVVQQDTIDKKPVNGAAQGVDKPAAVATQGVDKSAVVAAQGVDKSGVQFSGAAAGEIEKSSRSIGPGGRGPRHRGEGPEHPIDKFLSALHALLTSEERALAIGHSLFASFQGKGGISLRQPERERWHLTGSDDEGLDERQENKRDRPVSIVLLCL